MRILLIIAGVLLAIVLLALAGGYVWYQNATSGEPATALEAQYLTDDDRFVSVDGARVRVRAEGQADAPPVILIHGFTFSLES